MMASHKKARFDRTLSIRELPARYRIDPTLTEQEEEDILRTAQAILQRRLGAQPYTVTAPQTAADYLRLRVGELQHEVFGCLWLDNRHRVIAVEELFRGTVAGASVHPREVVRTALRHHAAAVVFYHNHPSGNRTPSQADQTITRKLQDALALIEVRVLDHLILAEPGHDEETGLPVKFYTSFAEQGLLTS